MSSAADKAVRRHSARIDGWYKYRGVTIKRNDSERGYSGHWTAQVGSIVLGTAKNLRHETRAGLLNLIDAFLDA